MARKRKSFFLPWGEFHLPEDVPAVFNRDGNINLTSTMGCAVSDYLLAIGRQRAEHPVEVRNFQMPSFVAWVNAQRPQDVRWGSFHHFGRDSR